MLDIGSHKNISVTELVLTILASEMGISDVIISYEQMGYAGIIWYLIIAIVYLFPLVMIFAEYANSVKHDHGGFYSWLINSLGEKWAFIGTFCWIGMILINVLQSVAGLGIFFSGLFLGKDTSGTWHLGSLNNSMIEAFLGIFITLLAVLIATRGLHKIALVSVIGGTLVLAIFVVFILLAFIIFFAKGMRFAQPIHGITSFIKSPNPQFESPIAVLSFIVYAMYAYGGIESSSGFIDKLRHPHKDYARSILIIAMLMVFFDVFGIFMCGASINWQHVMNAKGINLYNCSFYVMQSLGRQIVKIFGGSTQTGIGLGKWLIRFLSLGALLPSLSLVIVLLYSPIKGLIAGSRQILWPKWIARFNRYHTPAGAMWMECGIIVLALFFISFTGKNGRQFYQIIVDMGNIGILVPYLFLVLAFVAFEKRQAIHHSMIFFHHLTSVYWTAGLVLSVMIFGIIMNLIEPLLQHQYNVAFWTFIGPIFFITISASLYSFKIHKIKLKSKNSQGSF